ncbi:hypothetical protein H1R20_g14677, partial [Candolleomyces eurysporus]
MSNLLALPFKRTYPIDIKEAASNYIATQSGTHPDEFKGDIKEWQDLRNEGTGGVVHENRIQLTLLDIQLSIPYSLAFNATSVPVSLNSLAFERACVLFNLAALYSQLATAEDRSTPEGIKRATSHFQLAAGTLSYLKTSALSKLVLPHDEEIPADLTDGFLTGMEQLMLSQAQECCWQLAKLNQYKNSLIAKIALRVGSLYGAAYDAFAEAPPSAKRLLPSDWLPHLQVKSLHFQAVAQFRKSMDEIETGNNYGVELARLGLAQDYSKQAYEIARRGRVSTANHATYPFFLHHDQSLMETVEKGRVRAQRDNDLIYHKDVPAASSLPEIQETNLAKSTVPPGLLRPEEALKSKRPLFQSLIGWGAREAIKIYNHRKGDLIQTRIVDVSQELQDRADEQLRKLNLPASLEALERHVGLPPSLLHKAEEVRLENGPDTIEASLEDVEMLSGRDAAILDEALDILDNEASEDEASRKEYSISRPPSHEANIELTDKAARYRQILDQAKESDESVRQKWYEWEEHIRQLTEDEETLDRLVPSSTNPGSASKTPESRHTRKLAQNLRNRLENLDVLHRDRAELVRRGKAMAESDDVEARIMKAAAGFEKLAELHPAMFEDIMDEELAKYDKYLVEMDEQRKRVEEALIEIKSENEAFINSRKEDPAVKEREQALQQLDAAYFKYKEIGRNLDEGHKFYNDLAGILIQFREVCKEWSHQRNQELHSLTRKFQALSVDDSVQKARSSKSPSDLPPQPPSPRFPNNPPARKPPVGKSSLGKLPALTSDEWEFEEMPLPPGPKDRARK